MFQLHPGCIYVSSFSIIFLASGPTQICSFTLPPLLHSPPLRYPPAMLWLQHDVGTWRVPKEVQPLKPLKKVKVQRASCLCRWAPFNVWTSPAVTTRSSPNSQESPHIHIYWIWVNFHKNQRFMGRVTRDIWGHQSCHGPESKLLGGSPHISFRAEWETQRVGMKEPNSKRWNPYTFPGNRMYIV